MQQGRLEKLDNFRALLIALVVFGHLCDALDFPYSRLLFLLIYSFHIPAFVFLSGVCSKPGDPKKTVRRFIYPYFLFQLIFIFFERYALGRTQAFTFLVPIRLMWYLLSVATWKSLLPLFDTEVKWKRAVYVVLSVAAALAISYFPDARRILSIGRTIIFFPFFLAGYYLREQVFACARTKHKLGDLLAVAAVVLAVVILIYVFQDKIKPLWLYGTESYQYARYNPKIRFIIFVVAAILTWGVFYLTPRIHLPLITTLGQRTMPVYLLHGFVYLTVERYAAELSGHLWIPVVLAICCFFLFACKPVVWLTKPLTEWPFGKKKAAAKEKAARH